MSTRHATVATIALLAGACLCLSGGCERDPGGRGDDGPIQPEDPGILVFPDALRAADQSVNAFVKEAMRVCMSGRYESFRLVWSARYDPITREQFEGGWRAVEKITVLALERDEEHDSYAVYAKVTFNPDELPAEHKLRVAPFRDVVLLIIREQEDWKLTNAPNPVRAYMIERFKPLEPQPATSDPLNTSQDEIGD